MGGKGKKRREKNFLAAHGGNSRLPPPPNPSQVDALPSKLRMIMSLTSKHSLNDEDNHGSAKTSKSGERTSKQRGGDAKKKLSQKEAIVDEQEDGDVNQHMDDDSGDNKGVFDGGDGKKKKKRKRNQVTDLRFQESVDTVKTSGKKKERRKKYLEAKKKRKTSKAEENSDFPGHEKIKFGDVVQAPPKLVTLPKMRKIVPDASQERIRLKAIDAYRQRRGWTSRPGLQLPNVTATPSF
ncbi:uncharacterized protein LOC126687255 [Mercurialis annua]|uniref:uncharacterized protein LOC126687255 n=1 Tax=Mercurialis annua TaxID=3986 RepID=UPI002160F1F4|nr:uncharacterized protein LOC126687255 [Mercurialis annua]